MQAGGIEEIGSMCCGDKGKPLRSGAEGSMFEIRDGVCRVRREGLCVAVVSLERHSCGYISLA